MFRISRFLPALALCASAMPAVAADPPASDVGRRNSAIPADALQRQADAIAAMPAVTVTYDELGAVQTLEGDTGLYLSDPDTAPMIVDHGASALNALSAALRATGTERLSVRTVFPVRGGQRVIHYDQSIRGIPVKGGLALALDAETGRIISVGSRFLPDQALPTEAKLDPAEAQRTLAKALVGSRFAKKGSVTLFDAPVLTYLKSQEDGQPALAWLVSASYTSSRGGQEQREFWVNALTGRVEGSERRTAPALGYYSAGNQRPNPFTFPTGLTWAATDPVALAAGLNVLQTEVGWSQFTGTSMSLGNVNVVVNYGNPYNGTHHVSQNQHWLTFGTGVGPVRRPVSWGSSLDTVAHEWGHGLFMLQTGGSVNGSHEQLAMNEAYADLSAVIVGNRFAAGLGAFEIAEDMTTSGIGIRSWSTPKLADPRAVDWYPLRFLGIDPHHNVTIMGHAFYLLANGGTHYLAGLFPIPVINVQGVGFHRAAEIFHRAVLDPVFYGATSFFTLRRATENQANIFDPSGATRQSVSAAWDAVGLGHGCQAPPSTFPTVRLVSGFCRGEWEIAWPSVASATTYHAEVVPLGWPWSLAQTQTDGPFLGCETDLPTTMVFHIRACNGCGCSSFGPGVTLRYYPQCL
jgi:Zn-dependent metalloprotease